jgi:tetratricopeptide (TPR) repeat protein
MVNPFPVARSRRRRTLLGAGLALVVLGALALAAGKYGWPFSRTTKPAEPESSLHYRNVEPGVKYVGDRACTVCHETIAQSYTHHPMGYCFADVPAPGGPEYLDPKRHSFQAQGYHFLVEQREGSIFHAELKRDAQGKESGRLEWPVRYVLGSGRHGCSYVVEHDGYLFESPISWFSQTAKWDVSPGYERSFMHFNRPLTEDCLFCHVNRADLMPGTVNRFRQFRGEAIGCERCHGPGELHVQRHQRQESFAYPDDTIVNPRDLKPISRDSVCEQCHLQGEARVAHQGRSLFDYRPGLPLHEFLSALVRPPERADPARSVGHAEQMRLSRCAQASEGKMGCISCHNPHALPAADQRVRYYRDRCLKCHTETHCSLPPAERRLQEPQDSCIACHMPRADSTNIAHTVVTDHRIPRRRGPRPPAPAPMGGAPLVNFYADQVGSDDPDARRALAIVLTSTAGGSEMIRRWIVSEAVPALRTAVERDPNDVEALRAQSTVLQMMNRRAEALQVLETALERAPANEPLLEETAALATDLERLDTALGYCRRLLQVNPWQPRFHFLLASVHSLRRDWTESRQACRDALRLDPFSVAGRKLLIRVLLHGGEKDQARAELDQLLRLEPTHAEELRRWFDEQKK